MTLKLKKWGNSKLYNSRLLMYNYVKITVIYSKLLEILLQKLDTAEFCNRINC